MLESYNDGKRNLAESVRIWLKNQNLNDSAIYRFLGDAVAYSVGVIFEQEILKFGSNLEDK